MGKKKRIARYPQKFGRKYSAHPAFRAAHGEDKTPEPIVLDTIAVPEPALAPEPLELKTTVPAAEKLIAKPEPVKEKKAAKRNVSRKLDKKEKSEG